MRVALIDTSIAGSAGSMTRYRTLVLRAMQTHAPGMDVVHVPVAMPAALSNALRPRAAATWLNHAWMWRSCRRAALQPADLFHILDGSHAHLIRALPVRRAILTLHDMIPWLQMSGRFVGVRPPSSLARALVRAGLRQIPRAAHIVAVSASTRADAVRAGAPGSRITVVPPALDPAFVSSADHAGEADPFSLLHVGHAGFYKNRHAVLEVFASLADAAPWRLTLVGSPLGAAERRLLEGRDLASRVTIRPAASDQALIELYRASGILLFPSLYEGFGWPVVEAMACGCPVVCSNAGSLPETAGGAALMAEPNDVPALASHCRALTADPSLRDRLRRLGALHARRFSLENMAAGLAAAYTEAFSRQESRAR